MAVVAASLVMAGFAALFSAVAPLRLSQPFPGIREELRLAETTPTRPRPRPRAPLRRSRLPVQLPELQRMPPPVPLRTPDSFSLEDYLDERAKAAVGALKEQVTGSALRQDLGKSTGEPAISANQSYRSIDGQRVQRSGGGCAESQTQQGSPSPTNHFDVARPISCPGAAPDASQQMGKALDDWAKRHPQPPPPP